MDVVIGKVVKVFLPDNENQIDPQNIGFEIFARGTKIKITVPVDGETASILKDDYVSIVRQKIEGKIYYSVEKVDSNE